ncbi:MAG: iron ABC transporter permease [Treponema sp.]|nr:iron ABC transporter permease [Treponema sp.]
MDFYRLLRIASFTINQALCSTVLALLIALPAAFFCARRQFAGRRFLLSLSAVPFCLPALIIALGYVTFLGLNGGLNRFLILIFGLKEAPVKLLYSFAGLIIAQAFYNFPMIMKNVSDAWERLPQNQAESARLLGAGEFRIFRTITIFQLLPSIASSSMLVFIYCFLSFILVLLFGGIGNSTLEVEIYKTARSTLDYKYLLSLALFESIVLILIITLYCLLEAKSAKRTKGLTDKIYVKREKIRGWKEILSFSLTMFFILLFFIAPLLGILVNAFTSSKSGAGWPSLETFARVIKSKSFWPSVKSTFLVGIASAFLSTVLAFIYSCFLRLKENKNPEKSYGALKVLPMLPMAISSVVLGVIITRLVSRGSPIHLIFLQAFLNWPLAFRIIYLNLSKISDECISSALVISKNRLDVIRRIILPLSIRSLISAFGFTFSVSAGDTTLPLVLGIPKFNTLSLFTYGLAASYRFNEACAAGLILSIICIITFSFGNIQKKSKLK